jgi:hypothetical protein
LRKHLREYPVDLSLAKRFYRILTRSGSAEFREFQLDMLTARCVEQGFKLSLSLSDDGPSARSVARWTRAALGDGLIASAAAHRLLSNVALELGDEDRGCQELAISHMLEGRITERCAGTERDPYIVVDTQDEYLVLRSHRRRSVERTTVDRGDRIYDVHRCEDETEAWFDVTRHIQAYDRLNLVLEG